MALKQRNYKVILLIALAALTASGCTTIRKYNLDPSDSRPIQPGLSPSLVKVNKKLRAEHARVKLADGSVIDAFDVRIDPDSVSWFVPDTEHMVSVKTDEVLLVARGRKFTRGDGGLLGGILGAVAGSGVFYGLSSLSSNSRGVEIDYSNALFVLISPAIGAVVGAFVGSRSVGKTDVVVVYQGPLESYLGAEK